MGAHAGHASAEPNAATCPIPGAERTSSFLCGIGNKQLGKVALPIIPVQVVAIPGSVPVKTYALLDTGSNRTFCSQTLAHRLKAVVKKRVVDLATLNSVRKLAGADISFVIGGIDADINSSECVRADNAFATDTFPDLIGSLITRQEVQNFAHLRDLPLHAIPNGTVELIIGQDV